MATTGTFKTYDAKGIREDLSDVIYNISPTDTPFMNNAGRTTASNTYFEWQEDELASATDDNAAVEGADAEEAETTPTRRVGNYTQISTKNVSVSGTQESVDKAGRKSELSYQLAKRGSELKRDMEKILTSKQAAKSGGSDEARKTAGFEAFIRGDVALRGDDGEDPEMSGDDGNGHPSTAPEDGSPQELDEDLLKEALQAAWEAGADPELVMVGSKAKQQISGFEGIATRSRDVGSGQQAEIIGAADIYVGDFGEVSIVPNRFSRPESALVLDTDFIQVAYLRDFQTINLARKGDSEQRQMVVEYGLKVDNHQAHALITDIDV